METRISSATMEVVMAPEHPTVLIGERINPSGKKKMAAALKAGDLEIVRQEALAQVAAGADIIDVNVGTPGVDEVVMLPEAARMVMSAVEAPLCLDSTSAEALKAALKIYKGKALINSVSGEEASLVRVLPLVKEYGTAVIGLLQDDAGIPDSAEGRLAVAHKIIRRAEAMGIPRSDIILDCLAFAVAVNNKSVVIFLETVRRVKAELGVNLTVGASNVSFGLPERELLNNTFQAIAIANGVDCLIADVAKVRPTVLAADLLLGHDAYARRYITAYRQRSSPAK